MNKHDQRNLEFIMHLTRAQLVDWFHSISLDEQTYALELLEQANLEAALELNTTEPTDLSVAKQLLGRFTLKGEIL